MKSQCFFDFIDIFNRLYGGKFELLLYRFRLHHLYVNCLAKGYHSANFTSITN